MNNARYLRELDFARFHFYGLTGLYESVRQHKGGAVQGASSVRYRKTIPIFSPYKIETKLIWWDEKAIYIEQKFITLSDGFVRAIALSKQCITNCNVVDLLKSFPGGEKIPTAPEELQLWLVLPLRCFQVLWNTKGFIFFYRLNAIEVSSEKLRKEKKTT